MTSTASTRQRGTALIVAMLFLVILGMLGVTTMTSTTLEERMAGNARDRDIAMQAAEAALRDAERDMTNTNTAYRVVKVTPTNSFPATGTATCAAGLCSDGATISANITDPVKSAFYGQFTGELPVQGPVQQPRYMVELLDAGNPPAGTPAGTRNLRITARGVGKNSNTVVILQTVYQVTF